MSFLKFLAPAIALAGCGDAPAAPDRAARRAAPGGGITLGRAVPAGEIDMGGDMPRSANEGFGFPAEWRRWAEGAWPAACDRLDTAERVGRIPREGRTCAIAVVTGIVPTARVVASGTLMSDGERLPVRWTWTSLDPNRACAEDPVGTVPRRFRLTRSRAQQHWQATPIPVEPPFEDDPVHETCADLDGFLNGRH